MSKHSTHLTSQPELVHPWFWPYTYSQIDFDIALAQGSDFEAKGDKLSSSVECMIRDLIPYISLHKLILYTHTHIYIYISYIYIYYFECRRRGNMSPCTGSRVNSNYERIASRVGAQFRTRASKYQKTHSAHCYVQRPNHSVMPRPSKMNWHQLKGITHWTVLLTPIVHHSIVQLFKCSWRHYNDTTWAPWHQKLLTTILFMQHIAHDNTNENVISPHQVSVVGRIFLSPPDSKGAEKAVLCYDVIMILSWPRLHIYRSSTVQCHTTLEASRRWQK